MKDGVAAENEERARAQPDTSERDRGNRAGLEREKSTKFISGHPRAEPRPGTNSIASVALFRERAHGALAGAGDGRGEWLARWPATERFCPLVPLSLSLSHPSSSVATRRKSLRLTGSHGITGTRDIYASASTDRSITRNKEIANLLQEPSATPSGSSTLSAPSCPPPTFFLFFDIVRRRVEGGPVRELFRLLWVETAMGHPATFQMMGKKSCDKSGWWGWCSERGTKLIIRALWLPQNPYHSFRTIVEISHDDGR